MSSEGLDLLTIAQGGGAFLRERRELEIYKQLLALSPKLEERLYNGSEQDVYHIASLVSGRFQIWST